METGASSDCIHQLIPTYSQVACRLLSLQFIPINLSKFESVHDGNQDGVVRILYTLPKRSNTTIMYTQDG